MAQARTATARPTKTPPQALAQETEESIREKAHRWLGQIMSVKDAKDRFKVYLLLGEPQAEKLKPAFEKA